MTPDRREFIDACERELKYRAQAHREKLRSVQMGNLCRCVACSAYRPVREAAMQAGDLRDFYVMRAAEKRRRSLAADGAGYAWAFVRNTVALYEAQALEMRPL